MKVDNPMVAAPRSFLTRNLPLFALALVVSATSTGCTFFQGVSDYLAYNDNCDDAILGWRNHCWSWQAWRARKEYFRGQPQFYSFGEGFRAGYQDVASGGSGCPPAIPPRKYWSYGYQTPEGQGKTAAWFSGFPFGVAAAREDGSGAFRDIQVSGTVDSMYSSEFQNGHCPTCGELHLGTPGALGPETIDGAPYEEVPAGPIQPPALPQITPSSQAGMMQTGPLNYGPRTDELPPLSGQVPSHSAVRNVAYMEHQPASGWAIGK